NDSIFNMLPQLQDDESGEDDGDNIEDGEDVSRTFVPLMPPTQREGEAINATLDRMQNDNPSSLWPEIEGVPINEFHTPGYMVRAFPTLYPYGRADLRSAQEINDDLQDYVELINKLQRHTKCSPSYCLRSKHGQQ
ncbi:6187_t:CDS:2, partial [Rhizophagus irregularis]